MKYTITFLLLIIVFYTCIGQTKSNEKICPKPYTCVKVDYDSGLLIDALPLDKPVIIYGDNKFNNYRSGCFSVWEEIPKSIYNNKDITQCYEEELSSECTSCKYSKGNKYFRKIYGGSLKIKDSSFVATLPIYFKGNQGYKFKFDFIKTIPKNIEKVVNSQILKYYNNLDEKLLKNERIDLDELSKLREAVVTNLPEEAVAFIKKESILNEFPSPKLNKDNTTFDRKYLDEVTQRKDIISNIDRSQNSIALLLSDFLTASNISILEELYPKETVDILKKLNISKDLRISFAIGQIKFPDLNLLSEISYASINDNLLKKYIENLVNNKNTINDLLRKDDFKDSNLKDIPNKMLTIEQELGNFLKSNKRFANLQKLLIQQTFEEIKESFNISGSSYSDFETSGKWYASADIGALSTKLIGNENDSWRVIPYLGMNLYFVPVNKEAPLKYLFREYNFGTALLKITSLHFGTTIPVLNNSKYQGIFVNTDNTRGFIAGIGIRPYQAIRISGGWLFINRSNGTNFGASSTISGRPYLSISLDWDLRKIIPTVSNLFK